MRDFTNFPFEGEGFINGIILGTALFILVMFIGAFLNAR